ncbi:McrC family protein [Aliarcobacter cryaerophilus]|uniref:McrC family protein n=1 Tax=Aliarcobacter cryaerophilus TaxID=28198 RepID=UPI003AF3C0ED
MQNTIYEYESITDEKLKNHIINTIELHKYFTLDWKDLKAKQYCGILNFENQDFYILPKISNHNDQKDAEQNLNIFIYMLMYAYDIKLSNEQIASCQNQENHTILEVFVQMFALNILNELKKGLYKEYLTKQDNLPVLKGKYLINENLKYNFKKNKIYCEYDEFSSNNSLNQFFLYAVKYLQKFVNDKKLLKQCELIFDEVEYKQVDINRVETISFNRLNVRFKTSFEIALLLLRQSIPLFNKDKKSFAFLFDMNVLFEKFVEKLFLDIEPLTKIENKEIFNDLLLTPDILINKKLVADIKYKRINSIKDIKAEDRHQIYIYKNNFETKYSFLIYPSNNYNDKQDIVLGKNKNKTKLEIKFINLNYYNDISYEQYIFEQKKQLKLILRDIYE